MRRSFTAVVSRNESMGTEFLTEPYECVWASEARWFIRVLDVSKEGLLLRLRPQISPDGLFWCDEGHPGITAAGPGLYSFSLSGFGGWLRLAGGVEGSGGTAKSIIYLVLKE
jgi:hypothetical protein